MKASPSKRAKLPLHVYEIDDGETAWVIAKSQDEALKIYAKEFCNMTLAAFKKKPDGPYTIARCADEKELTIIHVDFGEETLTCREWVWARGAGILCSTAYAE